MSRAFLDTNVLLYAFKHDHRQRRALELLRAGGVISVQSLNEFANAARRRVGMDWDEVHDLLAVVRRRCSPILALTQAIHDEGLRVARRYGLSIDDGMIFAAALAVGCDTPYSEDMHHGLVIDGRLTVVNPFA